MISKVQEKVTNLLTAIHIFNIIKYSTLRRKHTKPNKIKEHKTDSLKIYKNNQASLCAFEALWDLLSANIKQQAQRNWHIKVDTQDICFNGGAEANCSLKIDKVPKEAATWSGCWCTNY